MDINMAEEFVGIQGEGHLVGKAMYFVRFGGCSVGRCPIRRQCDTDYSTKYGATPEEIADRARGAMGANAWVCITGGEPADQPKGLWALGIELEKRDMKIAIQTSGTQRVEAKWDWLTVSPKVPAEQIKARFGHELKLVLQENMPLGMVRSYYNNPTLNFWDWYIQPEWTEGEAGRKRAAQAVIELNTCKAFPQKWNLSLQQHKWCGGR